MTKEIFNIPRILIGAASSGSGKTTVTCGILKALQRRNLTVQSFKCGPDYIDPMFHRKVIGVSAGNLDLFFSDKNTIKYLMYKNTNENKSDIAVIEGVMGYYDGVAGKSTWASSYDVASSTETPSVLLVDTKGMSLSVVAYIKGFLEYKKDSNIKGIILNRMSEMIYPEIKKIIEEELGISVLGFIPKLDDISLESRHLGLITADEVKNLNQIVEKIADAVESHVDLDKLINLANSAPPLEFLCDKGEVGKLYEYYGENQKKVKIALAKDKAFSFYYDDNIKLLKELGCEIVEFSPVANETIPKDCRGLILGGGYPELYLKELSDNIAFKDDIKKAIESGMPCIAECGGFMYLHELIEDREGNVYEMAGIIKGRCYPLEKMNRFGYIDVSLAKDTVLGAKGTEFRAHEFHYWESENTGESAVAQKPLRKRNWKCIIADKNLFCGYPHIHFYSNIDLPLAFLKACRGFEGGL